MRTSCISFCCGRRREGWVVVYMAVVSLTTCAHVHGVETCVLIYLRTGVNLMRYWAILESESLWMSLKVTQVKQTMDGLPADSWEIHQLWNFKKRRGVSILLAMAWNNVKHLRGKKIRSIFSPRVKVLILHYWRPRQSIYISLMHRCVVICKFTKKNTSLFDTRKSTTYLGILRLDRWL